MFDVTLGQHKRCLIASASHEEKSLAGKDLDTAVVDETCAALESKIRDAAVPAGEIARLFDEAGHDLRLAVVRRLGRGTQRALYRKANGFAAVGLVDLVPKTRGDMEEVRHLGLNTLPAFRVFEKRFCRLAGEDAASPAALAGYNFQTMAPVTGPGYFVAVEDTDTREVLVDYRRLPEAVPADWPAIRSNERGLSRFVYGFMVDRLRRVSEHVTIGSAARKGKDLGSYFALTRDDG